MQKALFWKLLERFGVQGIQFLLQIILARLLDPEHYGVLSLMIVFTTLANVFVQQGFNTALIQNKDVTERDYSSVFWVTLSISLALYTLLFALAPVIARLYQMPDIVAPLRVLSLILIPGALNSVQIAKVSRDMDFRQVFRSNILAIITAGLAGIVLAYMGAGLWALVVQNLLNATMPCIVMWFTVKWRPRLVCDFARIKVLFSFGWKLLVSSLMDALYQDLHSLIVGLKYSSDTLGYFNRGKQFPQFFINAVNGAVQSVLLPAMSAKQDSADSVKQLTRSSITIGCYVLFPMMAGLACTAKPLVLLLLTEKWLPCVPFLQIYCITYAFYTVSTSNLQAINAMGRSDIFLKLEIIKKLQGLIVLVIVLFFFDSPLSIAVASAVSLPIGLFINAYPNKKLIHYSYFEQLKDIFPSLLVSLLMFFPVWAIQLLNMGPFITLVIQVISGVLLYVALSAAFRLEPYKILLRMLKTNLKKRTKEEN